MKDCEDYGQLNDWNQLDLSPTENAKRYLTKRMNHKRRMSEIEVNLALGTIIVACIIISILSASVLAIVICAFLS
jgi:hypothetical protein